MKPSKKKPAKRRESNPIVSKLLKLKYRINDAYSGRGMDVLGNISEKTKNDKSWVMNLISDVRDNNLTKLCKEDMSKCNSMWKEYSPSRLNDWVSYKND